MILKQLVAKPFLLLTLAILLIAVNASTLTVAQSEEQPSEQPETTSPNSEAQEATAEPAPPTIVVEPTIEPTLEPPPIEVIPTDVPTEAPTATDIQIIPTKIVPTIETTAEPTGVLPVTPIILPTVPITDILTAQPDDPAQPVSLPFHEAFDSPDSWLVGGAWFYASEEGEQGWFAANTAAREPESTLEYRQPIAVSGIANPELVLRQKGVLSSADVVAVDILPQAQGDWVALDEQQGQSISPEWSARFIDLSAYEGQVIRLRLRVTSTGTPPDGEISTAYWIDELAIREGTTPVEPTPLPTLTPLPTEPLLPTEIPLPTLEQVEPIIVESQAEPSAAESQAEPLSVEVASARTGLRGEYFNNANLTNRVMTRIDPRINFDWGRNAPGNGIAPNTFSVRWTGRIIPAYTEMYTFYTVADDGVRLWVNGQQIINNWGNGLRRSQGRIWLNAGVAYNIRLEYYENSQRALVRLQWSSPSQPKQVIPSARLLPPANNGSGGGGDPEYQVPFNRNSIWNRPIPSNPTIHPNSRAMINLLAQKSGGAFNIDGIQGPWSVPVYYANASDPVQTVCDSANYRPCVNVHVPRGFSPSPDADSKAVIVELFNFPPRAWAFYGMRRSSGRGDWTALNGAYGWGDISETGDGLTNYDGGMIGGRVSGFNYYAGLIHPEEIEAGVINHALNLNIPADAGCRCVVWPAIYGDGTSTSPNAIPIGSWIQLDPTLDVNSLNLSRGGKIIARAMQVYGAWVGDTGGMAAFSAREFVRRDSSGRAYVDSTPWQGLLSFNDTYNFPVNRLRVLVPARNSFYRE